jgi:hypothetical protein
MHFAYACSYHSQAVLQQQHCAAAIIGNYDSWRLTRDACVMLLHYLQFCSLFWSTHAKPHTMLWYVGMDTAALLSTTLPSTTMCHLAPALAAAAAAAGCCCCWLRRYISEDFSGVALHPVDIIDAASGRLLQQLTDLNLNTITPVNLPHPRLDIIISGSSRCGATCCWVQRGVTPQECWSDETATHAPHIQQAYTSRTLCSVLKMFRCR